MTGFSAPTGGARRPGPRRHQHTDRGSEYAAGAFRAACARLGACQSMGRPGSALDNAVIEAWHSTLEFELRSVEHFATRAEARARVSAWIHEYNHTRRHSACQMMSPAGYERHWRPGGGLRWPSLLRRPVCPGARPCPGRSSLDMACAPGYMAANGKQGQPRSAKSRCLRF